MGYIYVRRIRNGLEDSLDRAVKELAGVKGLIVDVRGNTGGGFDAARALRNFDAEDKAEPGRPRFGGTMAVLIDPARRMTIQRGDGTRTPIAVESFSALVRSLAAGRQP